MLVPVYKDGLWGFFSLTEKKLVVEPKFKVAYKFYNGFCPVSDGENLMYVDSEGNTVRKTNYQCASSSSDRKSHIFSEGMAGVCVENKWGFINEKCELVIEPTFEKVTPFTLERSVVVKDGKYGVIDKSGAFIFEAKYDYIAPYKDGMSLFILNGKIGYFDTDTIAIEPQFEPLDYYRKYVFSNFSEGVAAVRDASTQKVGFINKKGEFIIDPIYTDASFMSEGFARFRKGDDFSRYGLLNMKGEEVIPDNYTDIMPVKEGAVSLSNGEKRGLLSTSGDTLIPFEYKKLGNVYDGLIAAKKDGKRGYLNKNGEVAIEFKFDMVYGFENGFARVENEEFFAGVIDTKGEVIVPFEYENINI